MKMGSKEDYLTQVYYNPENPVSFSGLEKIYRYVKENSDLEITRKDIREFLQKQDTYTGHKQIVRNFPTQRVIVSSIGYQWDLDLASLQNKSKYNDGYKYFLLAIDCFSKFVYTAKLKTKQPSEVMIAFESFLTPESTPRRARTDKGLEFTAKISENIFKKHQISHFVTQNNTKANIAERAIKTVKTRLTKAMHARNSHKWIDLLEKVTKAYNASMHSTIGFRPKDVKKEHEVEIWTRVYEFNPKNKSNRKNHKIVIPKSSFKYKIGDAVKLAYSKYVFQREYSERWTSEVFFISQRNVKENIQIYKVKDFKNREITGVFYQHEIQKVDVSDDTEYKIEKVIKEKFMNRQKYLYVKWLNYSNDFNTWIKASEVSENLNKLYE